MDKLFVLALVVGKSKRTLCMIDILYEEIKSFLGEAKYLVHNCPIELTFDVKKKSQF